MNEIQFIVFYCPGDLKIKARECPREMGVENLIQNVENFCRLNGQHSKIYGIGFHRVQ